MKKRLLPMVFAVYLLIALGLSCTTGYTQTEPHRVEVHVKRFAFTPTEATIKRGDPVVLVLTSEDANHGLRIKQLNIDLHVQKGKTTEVQFTPQTAGDFIGHCSVFCGAGHGGMTFTLHVVD